MNANFAVCDGCGSKFLEIDSLVNAPRHICFACHCDELYARISTELVSPDKQDPYTVTIGNVRADPARIARAYGITDPMIFQALKKLLRSGRKHKSLSEDVAEVITSLQRWQEMEKEDKG